MSLQEARIISTLELDQVAEGRNRLRPRGGSSRQRGEEIYVSFSMRSLSDQDGRSASQCSDCACGLVY